MKRWIIIISVFCLGSVAYANPVIVPDPTQILAYVMVLGSAVAIEAAIVTLILMFWGTELKQVYMAVVVGNLIIYLTAFLPLLDTTNVWLAEAAIVGLDGVLIKAITLFEVFRDNTFRPLRWGYAFVIAAVGNIVSYFVGVAING